MRLLSSLLIALALLVSPLAMASGSAAAMPHGGAIGTEEVAVTAHCAGTDAPDHQAPDPGMSCTAACAAFPALPPLIGEPFQLPRPLHSVARQQHLPAIELEGETPPPRMTPRI